MVKKDLIFKNYDLNNVEFSSQIKSMVEKMYGLCTRRDNRPTFNHTKRVACMYYTTSFLFNDTKNLYNGVMVSLLHDVLEDTRTEESDLIFPFLNKEIVSSIKNLTRPEEKSSTKRYNDLVDSLVSKVNLNELTVKLCDRLDNCVINYGSLYLSSYNTKLYNKEISFYNKYILETLNIVNELTLFREDLEDIHKFLLDCIWIKLSYNSSIINKRSYDENSFSFIEISRINKLIDLFILLSYHLSLQSNIGLIFKGCMDDINILSINEIENKFIELSTKNKDVFNYDRISSFNHVLYVKIQNMINIIKWGSK